jgi:aspartate dehydrogenase
LHLLAGAIAGIDGISAAKEGGLQKVTYKGCKSPKVAATLALAGNFMAASRAVPVKKTVASATWSRSTLTVDPTINKNKHTIVAEGGFGQMTIELVGVPLPSNPKTAMVAATLALAGNFMAASRAVPVKKTVASATWSR